MKKIMMIMFLSFSTLTYGIDLTNVSQSDLEGLLEDLSGNMVHSAATGASSSTIFGFQLGVIGSMIDAPNIEKKDSDADSLINGGLFGSVDLPLGFGAEAIVAPIKVGDLDYNYTSIAGHWATSLAMLDLKLRGFITNGKFSFKSNLNDGTSTNVDYEYSGHGLNLSVGLPLPIINPYAGIGYISGESKLIANGIFDGSTTKNIASAGVDTNSTYFFGGAAINLLLARVGIEASNPYGNNRITGRLSFGF